MKTTKLLALASLLAASSAMAQQYPTHAVTLMVPFAPGPTDTVARVIAQSMQKPLGQSIVVENRPSAGGIVGGDQVAKGQKDGYTLLMMSNAHAVSAAMYKKIGRAHV